MRAAADDAAEQLEVVSERNEVVGTAARRDIHTQGLLHRAAYCWVLDSSRQVLLQQRSHGKRIGPGLWDVSLAEHLDPGESYEEAARRGLHEELSIDVVSALGSSSAAFEGPLSAPMRRSYQVRHSDLRARYGLLQKACSRARGARAVMCLAR